MSVFKSLRIILITLVCLNFVYSQKPELIVQSGHPDSVKTLAVSPDGKILASGDISNKLWDIESGRELKTLIGYDRTINTLAFSPDGKILASGGADRKVIL